MKKIILYTFLLVLCGCSTYSGNMQKGVYIAPNREFSVKVPYEIPDVMDSKAIVYEGKPIVQFVEFYVHKNYLSEGFQTLDWLVKPEILDRLNKDIENRLPKTFHKKEKGYELVAVGNDFHCEKKTINGYRAYQCSELVVLAQLPKDQPQLLTITAVFFSKRIGVALGLGTLKEHNQFVSSIKPLI